MGRAQRFLCAASVVFTLALAPGSAVAEEKEDVAKPAPPRTLADPALDPDAGLRVIRVRVACDEEFRERHRWEDDARARVLAASEEFEKRFKIRWRVREIVPWVSADQAKSLSVLMRNLRRGGLHHRVDLVLAFTAQRQPRLGRLMRGKYVRGRARYFGNTAIVRVDPPSAHSRRFEQETLLHELGHVLGAWHSSETSSVMRPGWGSKPRSHFDEQAAAVFGITRDLDFSLGVESLTDTQIAAINEQWRKGHHPESAHPVAQALRALGSRYQAWRLPRNERAIAAHRKAVEVYEGAGMTEHGDLAECLFELGTMELERGRLDDAIESLERAATIRYEGYTDEEPLGAAAMKLVAALIQAEEFEKAEMWCRRAIADRVNGYGRQHHHVADALRTLGKLQYRTERLRDADATLEHALAVYAHHGLSDADYAQEARARLRVIRGLDGDALRRQDSVFLDERPLAGTRATDGRFHRPGRGRFHVRVPRAHSAGLVFGFPEDWSVHALEVAYARVGRMEVRVLHRSPGPIRVADGKTVPTHTVTPVFEAGHRFERLRDREVRIILAYGPARSRADRKRNRFDAELVITAGNVPVEWITLRGALATLPDPQLQADYGIAPRWPDFAAGTPERPMVARVWKWASVDGAGVPDFDVPMHTWFLTVKFDPEE